MTDPRTDPERAAQLVESGAITRERSCTSKVAHLTRNAAKAAAKKYFRDHDRHAVVYRCPFEDHWHLRKMRHGEGES